MNDHVGQRLGRGEDELPVEVQVAAAGAAAPAGALLANGDAAIGYAHGRRPALQLLADALERPADEKAAKLLQLLRLAVKRGRHVDDAVFQHHPIGRAAHDFHGHAPPLQPDSLGGIERRARRGFALDAPVHFVNPLDSLPNQPVGVPQRQPRGRVQPNFPLRQRLQKQVRARGGRNEHVFHGSSADFYGSFHPAHAPFVLRTASALPRVRRSGIAGAQECCSRIDRSLSRSGNSAGTYSRIFPSGSACKSRFVRAENEISAYSTARPPVFTMRFISGGIPPSRR